MNEGRTKKIKPGWLLLACLLSGFGGAPIAFSQSSPPPAPASSQLIQFLNQTISWYRQLATERQIATEPDDEIVVYNNRQIADQVVRLAFDFARAQADVLAKQAVSEQAQNASAPAQYQALRQMQATLDKQYQDTQAELDGDKQQLATATGRKHQELESQISELQGEIALAAARRDAVRNIVEFVSGASTNGLGATGLRAQIEALAVSVPAATSSPANAGQNGTPSSSAAVPSPAVVSDRTDISGMWDLTADVFSLSGNVRTVDSIIQETDALSNAAKELRTPYVRQLRDLSNRGDQLAAQADTADPAQLAQEKQQLDTLAEQFKQVSSAVVPLSKQAVLLDLYQRSLVNWRNAIAARYRADLRNLGARLVFLALILALVIGAAELWRRAVYRYVHEPRRRYQFLLLRKFSLWFLIALIIAFTLAGKLGSVVTFAGLLTAGVAVALQNVILSVVGYFFLIGKFGIRVGDRVQISGVTGEVIDIGLVRLHLMELGGGGFDAPTGRVVAFSNSIVFQPSAGLFKQIPGTSFVWHEIALTMPRGADFGLIKEKLLGAVTRALANYREEMERQYREMERTAISVSADGLRPKIQLHIVSSGIEAVIRYPADLRHAPEIDERVSHEVLKAIEEDPKLKAIGPDSPVIRLRTDLSVTDAAS